MNIRNVIAAGFFAAAITGMACAPADEADFDPNDEAMGLDEGIDSGNESSVPEEVALPEEEAIAEPGGPEEVDAPPPSEEPVPSDPSKPASPAGPQYEKLGWNLDFLYAGGFVFADKMKMARGWVSASAGTWDDGRPLELDANGWPTALAPGQHAVTLVNVHGGGQYAITWKGAGTVEIIDHLGVVSNEPNRIVVETESEMQLQLRVTSLPVKDIEVRKVGVPATAFWDPVFLERLAGTKVLRFMQWGMTNGDSGGVPTRWSERSKPDYFTQRQTYGVAYEHMIALANELGADAWINVPHLADDEYVRSLATLLKNELDPSLKVYVEWSNEVWNDAFPQGRWARAQGTAAGLGGGDEHLARLQFQARRTKQVFVIFESVFADAPERLVRVVASQTGNDWNDAQLMGFEGLAEHADALAIAPYFGYGLGKERSAQQVRGGGVGWVLDELEQVSLPQLIEEIERSAASAERWGVPLIAYEGGQHVVAEPAIHNDASVTSVLEAAQRDPRMYTLYRRMLDAWTAAGGGVFVHYTYTGTWGKWGYWGALERNDEPIDGPGAHKYRAIIDWAKSAP